MLCQKYQTEYKKTRLAQTLKEWKARKVWDEWMTKWDNEHNFKDGLIKRLND